jgi:cysteinyl-tRNA synthetase
LIGILGVDLAYQPERDSDAEPYIELLVEIRERLREQKLWELSDRIRDQLAELDVVLEDKPDGTRWHWE